MKSMLIAVARITLLAAFAAGATAALAQSSPDDFESLIATKKLAEAETLARARTTAHPRDDNAWWFLARAVAEDPKSAKRYCPGSRPARSNCRNLPNANMPWPRCTSPRLHR